MAAPIAKVLTRLKLLHVLRTCTHGESCIPVLFVRHRGSKHWNPKFKKERRDKIVKPDIPDYEEMAGGNEKKSPDEFRKEMKKDGRAAPHDFNLKPINISCTSGVFESFVPPEGDGKSSLLSKDGAKDRLKGITLKGKSLNESRKVRQFDDTFTTKVFPSEAMEIYTEAQKLLEDVKKNEDRLHELVTVNAYPKMTFGMDLKTFRWNFIESVEPPRVVHVRTTHMLSKDNVYAQATVRFHTRQTLAMYDRFGRLMYGSENLIKDVLEYVVFEKHISDEYGQWRIHDKIIPDWMPSRDHLIKTYVKPKFGPLPELKKEKQVEKTEESSEPVPATA